MNDGAFIRLLEEIDEGDWAHAEQRVRDLENQLTPAQLEKAQSRVQELGAREG